MVDVVVVGGSVAGAATAGFLARAGVRVVVLDAAQFPRWKACGEGLLPQGVAVLERMGVSIPEAIPLRGIRFRVGGTAAWMPFPRGRGLAVSRYALDEAIRARSAALGAQFMQARVSRVDPGRVFTDHGEFRASVVIGADGIRSTVRRSLGIRASYRRDRVGFSTHWEGSLREPRVVEVTAFPGGEVYVAPLDEIPSEGKQGGNGHPGEILEPGRALTALLVDRGLHVTRGTMEAFVRERFASRFGSAQREGPVLGAFPLGAHVDRVYGPGWLLVGDAAGMVDPISGEGMSLALQGAELAAQAVTDLLGKVSADPFPVYAARLRRLHRPIERVTAAMLFLSRHRRVARVALARDERLAPLMRVATGEPGLLTRIAGL